MRFDAPQRRQRGENIVPMINVVFLLLIFFLMTAQITPPEPFDLTPPTAETEDPADGILILYLSATGEMGFAGLTGEPAYEALIEETGEGPLTLRADSALPARDLTALVRRLQADGIGDIDLAVIGGG